MELRPLSKQRGAASVEHVGLVLLAAALAFAAVLGAGELLRDGKGLTPPLASELLRKQRCAVRYPHPCWQDPLTEAYGRSIAGAVRALAPAPEALPAPDGGGPVVGVDYRQCRQTRCATPQTGSARLTISNRRTTAFVSIDETSADAGAVAIDYWIYRPALGWEHVRRTVSPEELTAYATTPLTEDQDPKLVPLELTLGRDEARFSPGEVPPWRHLIESRWGGR